MAAIVMQLPRKIYPIMSNPLKREYQFIEDNEYFYSNIMTAVVWNCLHSLPVRRDKSFLCSKKLLYIFPYTTMGFKKNNSFLITTELETCIYFFFLEAIFKNCKRKIA